MKMKPTGMVSGVAGAASGLLLTTTQLFPATAPLQLVAFLPMLFVLSLRDLRKRDVARAGLYAGAFYSLPQTLAMRMPLVITLALLLHITVLMIVLAFISWRLIHQRGHIAALGIGSAFVIIDWLNFTVLPFWGTAQSFARPWSSYPSLIGFVSFTGITGIFFACGAFQAMVVKYFGKHHHFCRQSIATAAVLALFLLLGCVIGNVKDSPETITVAAVGWTHADLTKNGNVNTDKGFEALCERMVQEAKRNDARLVVFSELAFHFKNENDYRLSRLKDVARRNDVFIATGYSNGEDSRNRMLFIDPEGTVVANYTKTFLTPFDNSTKGDGTLAMIDIDKAKAGGMICQDDNFTKLSRGYGRHGVNVVAVPTYDWLAVKDAHLQSSIHRAIESHYSVVRATCNGISAIIGPDGKILAKRDHFKDGAGIVVADVPIASGKTLFSLMGNWLVGLCGLFLVTQIRVSRKNPHPNQPEAGKPSRVKGEGAPEPLPLGEVARSAGEGAMTSD